MKTSPENSTNETDDRVWDLLENASTTEPGDFFSRNVVREVRKFVAEEADRKSSGLFGWFRKPVMALAGGVAAIVMLALAFGPQEVEPAGDSVAASEVEFYPTEEFEDVNYLGELMAVTNPAMLSDQAFADLF